MNGSAILNRSFILTASRLPMQRCARHYTRCATAYPVELVAHLGAELPMLIRGMYYEGWHPSAARLKEAHATDFNDSVRRELRGHEELQHIDQVTRAVLRVIDQRLEPGQIAHVIEALPEKARRLWRDAH